MGQICSHGHIWSIVLWSLPTLVVWPLESAVAPEGCISLCHQGGTQSAGAWTNCYYCGIHLEPAATATVTRDSSEVEARPCTNHGQWLEVLDTSILHQLHARAITITGLVYVCMWFAVDSIPFLFLQQAAPIGEGMTVLHQGNSVCCVMKC